MSRSFHLGTVFGFPIRVNVSFLFLLLVVLVTAGGAEGLAVALLAAASILVHELGHALVARRLGVPVAFIELHFFGGAAQMTGMPRGPNDEILVAAAGPAVSLALAGLSFGLAALTGAGFFHVLGSVNLVLGLFNLLPAFPSDGGRILRAWLARRHGLVRATDRAVAVGKVVCLALGLIAVCWGPLQLGVVAVVLWMMGSAERLRARMEGDRGLWRGRDQAVEYFPPGAPGGGVLHARPAPVPRSGPVVVKVWRF